MSAHSLHEHHLITQAPIWFHESPLEFRSNHSLHKHQSTSALSLHNRPSNPRASLLIPWEPLEIQEHPIIPWALGYPIKGIHESIARGKGSILWRDYTRPMHEGGLDQDNPWKVYTSPIHERTPWRDCTKANPRRHRTKVNPQRDCMKENSRKGVLSPQKGVSICKYLSSDILPSSFQMSRALARVACSTHTHIHVILAPYWLGSTHTSFSPFQSVGDQQNFHYICVTLLSFDSS